MKTINKLWSDLYLGSKVRIKLSTNEIIVGLLFKIKGLFVYVKLKGENKPMCINSNHIIYMECVENE